MNLTAEIFKQSFTSYQKKALAFLPIFFGMCSFTLAQNITLTGRVTDVSGSIQASYVGITLTNSKNNYRIATNENGEFILRAIASGKYSISLVSLNFKTKKIEVNLSTDTTLRIELEPLSRVLDEVYVTAVQRKGTPSTSIIDKKAMELLQPSSFTDLLELLPGGRASTPNLTNMNQIRLREPSNAPSSGYDVGSLGTAFYIDGAPINTNANMQTTSGYTLSDPNGSRSAVDKGVDMRSISTDQIEKVEIVKGIASAEYGDLTSGLVKIQRKKGNTPYTSRIKADGFSKLVSIGKGVSILEKNLFINANVDILDSKADPRNNFENYKRLSSSIRTEKFWENDNRKFIWNSALDYAVNVDNEKTDPDNAYDLTDSYVSKYNNYTLANGFKFEAKHSSFFKGFDIISSVNYQRDMIDLTKWVQARSATVLINSLVEGAHDAKFVTPSYAAELDVEGRPFHVFLKASSRMEYTTGKLQHQLKIGTEYNYSKNFGNGQIYDLDFPLALNSVSSVRPRAFNDIPALQNLSFFVENGAKAELGNQKMELTAGVRGTSIVGMDQRYKIANHIHLDPRLNLVWYLPATVLAGKKLEMNFGGGFGLHHKLPTLNMLYPNKFFIDNVQLNYYHNNPNYRIANAMTTIINSENYALSAAKNLKWELNAELSYDGNRLSLTYFRENMSSGFRTTSRYRAVEYKSYNSSSVDANTITTKPSLADFTYSNKKEFFGYGVNGNGSGMFKEGIEYQFSSKRISAIHTRFTLSGAWFNNTYKSTQLSYGLISSSVITDDKVRQFIGVYAEDEGTEYQQLNTNLTVDSYLPTLGLMLSASVQSLWFTSSKENFKTGVPLSYIDIDEVLHPYTKASETDANLRWLLQNYGDTRFRQNNVPINIQVNIKASKDFKNKARISMFVNRFLTYTPPFTRYGTAFFRQAPSSYFGMELNFNF